MAPSPLPEARLKQIAQEACDSARASAASYAHASTPTWNNTIISHILQTLISETAPSTGEAPAFKFVVNSTIIQHSAPSSGSGDASATDAGSGAGGAGVGRRGMHSAAGGFWNDEKDGMWSYKYEGGEKRGMDVIVLITWVGV